MGPPRRVVMIVAFLAAATATAGAEDGSARGFVRGSVERARRSFAIGPLVGAGVSYAPGPEHLEVPLSFGIGVALFDVPVLPEPKDVGEQIAKRVAARVAARAAGGGGAPTPDELAAITIEVGREVKAEILARKPYQGRTIERPRFTLALEGAYLPRADTWQARATVGFGVKRVTVGPTIAGNFADRNGLYLGGELAVHLTPRSGPRSPVIDLYGRADLGVTSATSDAHTFAIGLRAMLDLI